VSKILRKIGKKKELLERKTGGEKSKIGSALVQKPFTIHHQN